MRALLFLSLAASLALPASADDLLTALRNKTFDAPAMAFTAELFRDGFEAIAKVDPSQPQGQRFVVTAPGVEDWPEDFAEFVENSDENTEGEIWCNQFLEAVPENAERTAESETAVIYSFTPVPEEDADGTEQKLFRKLVGTLEVAPDTLTVTRYSLHLPAPAKPHFMAKVENFEMLAECSPAENGNSYFTRFEFRIAGSAMGQDFSQDDRRVLLDATPAGSGAG
ncbi:MAG: hypothetical protein MRY64_06190 [Hyphomonadaceae bacterium]|nr:hypothetical protein [Hyphomonadaceae bacterium]